MEFMELVNMRYSCRKYTAEKVEREKIEKCIEAARLAPSASNSQPWDFVVIDDPEKLQAIADAAITGIYGATKFIKKASAVIVVTADKGGFIMKAGNFLRDTSFYLIDIGIACEHLVLQAAELGLGTCYVGWLNEKAVKKELGIKKSVDIPLIISMGYPDKELQEKTIATRQKKGWMRKPFEKVMKYQ
ncbi:MAG: nitroreductase family protein [Acidobacteriota bacterium]